METKHRGKQMQNRLREEMKASVIYPAGYDDRGEITVSLRMAGRLPAHGKPLLCHRSEPRSNRLTVPVGERLARRVRTGDIRLITPNPNPLWRLLPFGRKPGRRLCTDCGGNGKAAFPQAYKVQKMAAAISTLFYLVDDIRERIEKEGDR